MGELELVDICVKEQYRIGKMHCRLAIQSYHQSDLFSRLDFS